jgi:hypothetical protein
LIAFFPLLRIEKSLLFFLTTTRNKQPLGKQSIKKNRIAGAEEEAARQGVVRRKLLFFVF